MSSQNKKSNMLMSLVYLIIYLFAAAYNYSKGNKTFVFIWSALFLINLGYLIYKIFASKNKKP